MQEQDLDGLVSPSLKPAAEHPESSAAQHPCSDEVGEEEEDSLVIIDKDLDDDMEFTRSSAGAVLDRTELESVPELSPVTNH